MACPPFRDKKLQILVFTFGKNTLTTSLTTSQSRPSPTFNPILQAPSSTAKTNTLHHYESFAHVCIIRPWTKRSLTLFFTSIQESPATLLDSLITQLNRDHGRS